MIRLPRGLLSTPGVDLAVFHPSMAGYRLPCRVTLTPSPRAHMLRAFKASEPPLSIAMDQVLVPAGADRVTLMLPLGWYRLVQQDNDREQTLGYAAPA